MWIVLSESSGYSAQGQSEKYIVWLKLKPQSLGAVFNLNLETNTERQLKNSCDYNL